jgi:hypothetical protein
MLNLLLGRTSISYHGIQRLVKRRDALCLQNLRDSIHLVGSALTSDQMNTMIQHVLLMQYLCYQKFIEPTKPRMSRNGKYLQIPLVDGLNLLHNVVMERPLGQKARDGLDGGHGYGKTLDNRKRVLTAQTPSINNSERGDYDAKSVPGVVGVVKKNGKFAAQIGSFFVRHVTVHLGTYETAEEASAVYQFAVANKQALVEACKGLKNRNAEVRARCVAKRC